jgi:flagellar hook assembly protein FlgD
VRITIFNLLGQKIRTLVDEEYLPGYHSVVWDGTDERSRLVASGIFFYMFKAGNNVHIKKMVLLK